MLTQNIRRQFLDYFKNKQHVIVPSSPVIPHDDPTLLFNNAGMNQFKDVFLGKTSRDYVRAASSQKCVRVGGKHNDLDNVGHTSRHLTFFEMLGNFSFGDYFKEEAIRFAWEVSTEIFCLDPDRIWPTVFREDDEAFELWTQFVPAERITRFGEADNFWSMGDTGPCGPCSELLYDRGSSYGEGRKPSEDPSGERFLEFWNLVFMQYNKLPSGEIQRLPRPSIDTGAGLERVVDLKMGVKTVFDTDVLRSLIVRIEEITGIPYKEGHLQAPAFRVIADHLRCLSFAIADGVQPSNVDRGYVLRKILRRAVRYGRQLGMDRPFLAEVFPQLIETMGQDYPELIQGQHRIEEILTLEEEAFIRTLRRGGNILNQIIEKSKESTRATISGEDAFKLKDTYGLPIEEVLLIAKDSNLKVDEEKYRLLEEEARQRSRDVQKINHQFAEENIFSRFVEEQGPTNFLGYSQTKHSSDVIGILSDGSFKNSLQKGEEGWVILKETPFYAEMGGQVGDSGHLQNASIFFEVNDCISPYKGLIIHKGKLIEGELTIGAELEAIVDEKRRHSIQNNHTATHLLHWALHEVLGKHIKQAGSVVDPQRLRFDFSHHKPLSLEEIRQIEDLVNEKIRENLPVAIYEIPYEEAAKKEEIKQFFGEKYGSVVRVVDIDYSKELCGGTHTNALGTIGLFRIAKESSIAAGVRRIEAVTGKTAENLGRENEDLLIQLGQYLKTPVPLLDERIKKLIDENKKLHQEFKVFRTEKLENLVRSFVEKAEKIKDFRLVAIEPEISLEELRPFADKIVDKMQSGIAVVALSLPEKCHLLIKVSKDLVQAGYSADQLLKIGLPIVDGNGGGKAEMAQGLGKSPEKLKAAFKAIEEFLKK